MMTCAAMPVTEMLWMGGTCASTESSTGPSLPSLMSPSPSGSGSCEPASPGSHPIHRTLPFRFHRKDSTKRSLRLEQDQLGGHHRFQANGQPLSNQLHAALRGRLAPTVEGHPECFPDVQPTR